LGYPISLLLFCNDKEKCQIHQCMTILYIKVGTQA
jgi:hypothetical protein